jgi:hypothetical protein
MPKNGHSIEPVRDRPTGNLRPQPGEVVGWVQPGSRVDPVSLDPRRPDRPACAWVPLCREAHVRELASEEKCPARGRGQVQRRKPQPKDYPNSRSCWWHKSHMWPPKRHTGFNQRKSPAEAGQVSPIAPKKERPGGDLVPRSTGSVTAARKSPARAGQVLPLAAMVSHYLTATLNLPSCRSQAAHRPAPSPNDQARRYVPDFSRRGRT